MDEDNLSSQADEVEALSAIYGDEFEYCNLDPSTRSYGIKIRSEDGIRLLVLEVTLPPEYPSCAPPQYQINGPWLRGEDRMTLANSLEEIFIENIGENLIFMWVEKIREFISEFVTIDSEKDGASQGDHSGLQEDYDPPRSQDSGSGESMRESDVTVPDIFTGDTIQDRKSTFQPFVAAVSSVAQVKSFMDKLLENKKIANATHNIYAYRIKKEPVGTFYQGCEDDGETQAGSRLLHLLHITGAENVIIVVTRWYGGIHLGPDRFKHINNCARQLLEARGFISSNKEEKKPGKGKKGKPS